MISKAADRSNPPFGIQGSQIICLANTDHLYATGIDVVGEAGQRHPQLLDSRGTYFVIKPLRAPPNFKIQSHIGSLDKFSNPNALNILFRPYYVSV